MSNIAQICVYKDCKREKNVSFRRGHCGVHYKTWLKENQHDSVLDKMAKRPAIVEGDIAKIPLGVKAKDGYSIVDADMAWLADKYKFNITHGTGYAAPAHDKSIKLHNIIIGKAPKGHTVDHINRDRLDNRRSNLRIVTWAQNVANAKGQPNLSGYKGVAKAHGTRWRAYYTPYGKQIIIGYYDTKEEAAKAYDKAAKERWGEFAYQNFPTA